MISPGLAIMLNALALYAISGILLAAFAFQFALQELPCPLCLLQRAGFAALAIGPVLNIRHGPRPGHYGLSILAALAGAAFAARQVLLHIMPDDPGYGSAVLGYHYYSWAFICFVIALIALAVMLMCEGQFSREQARPEAGVFAKVAVWLVIAMTALNFVGTVVECGPAACPDNPVDYKLLTPGTGG